MSVRRWTTLAALVGCLAALPSVAAPAEPLLGTWRTQAQNGVVEIYRCGDRVCGRVVDGAPLRANPDQRDVRNNDASLRGRRVMHLRVLDGFTGGPSEWTGGPVYDPDTGDSASKGYLTLSGDKLSVKGCVAVFLCRTQVWTRLPPSARR